MLTQVFSRNPTNKNEILTQADTLLTIAWVAHSMKTVVIVVTLSVTLSWDTDVNSLDASVTPHDE